MSRRRAVTVRAVTGCAVVPITVVISTLDRPELLDRCLGALLTGTSRPTAVVVVDQGGGSASPAISAARGRGLAVEHVVQQRRGLSASQNAGVGAASTDVVAIVDDDCVPDRSWLEVIEAAFATAPGPLLLTGRVLPLPPTGDRVTAVSSRTSTDPAVWSGRPPRPWHLGTGGNFAVHRAAFVAVGGNDERLGTGAPGKGGNDLDLFHRLVVSGVTARYEPALLVHHERSTVAEHRSRRGTYGFGVGAMLGIWFRRRDPLAPAVLLSWLRLRGRLAIQRRREGGVGQETRVLLGTMQGLVHGLSRAGRGEAGR